MKRIIRKTDVRNVLRPRARKSHKGDFGHILIIAGSENFCGAAVLCVKAALKMGAGLVTLACAAKVKRAVNLAVPESMTLTLPHDRNGELAKGAFEAVEKWLRGGKADLVVLGPGLGRGKGVTDFVGRFLGNIDLPVLLDADALNVLAVSGPGPLRCRSCPSIITPHPGEAQRLLGKRVGSLETDRLKAAVALSRLTGSVAVLKGFHTVIAGARRTWINPAGGPALAKGGSGDVLSGFIGALWAIIGRREGFDAKSAEKAAAAGVYLHGLCGDLAAKDLTENCVLASDLIDYLPAALID